MAAGTQYMTCHWHEWSALQSLKLVLSIPLSDLYMHDGHFQSVIPTSFATEHGIDLYAKGGGCVSRQPIVGSYHGAYGHLQHSDEGKEA